MYDNSAIKSIGFADDGTLLITGICIKTIYDIVQKALHHAKNWAAENGLKFCPKKKNHIIKNSTPFLISGCMGSRCPT
jgi:hypothetical protein